MVAGTQQGVGREETAARRRGAWRQHVLGVVVIGGLGYGVLSIMDRPGLAVTAAVAAVLIAVLIGVAGYRSDLRADLLEVLQTALRPAVDESTIRASAWSGWPGAPGRLRIRYSPLAGDDAPDWGSRILEILQRRLDDSYAIKNHDRRRRLVVIHREETVSSTDEGRETEIRARAIVPKLLGSATLDVATDAAGELVSVTAKHSAGVRVAAAGYRIRVERAVTTMLPGRWKADWDLTSDRVTFRLRPTFPTAVPHPLEPVNDKNLYKLPVGVDEDGRVVPWDLTAGGPHALVAGKTGTGKTVLINGVVMEASRRSWPVWVGDPKRIEFLGLRGWPNVQIVATSVVDILAMLKCAHDLMEERYEQIEAGASESDFEPLIVVVDEYRNLSRQIDAWWAAVRAGTKGLPAKCPAYNWLPALAEKARSARIHLLVGTQRPDAAFLGEGLRDNFDSRFSLGPLSPQGAQMMWEAPHLGVAVPRNARGRGTGRVEDERIDEIQVYWTPDPRRVTTEKDQTILDSLRPSTEEHGPLAIVLGEESDLDGNDLTEWHRILEARMVPSTHAPARTRPDVERTTVQDPSLSDDSVLGAVPTFEDPEVGQESAREGEFGPETSVPATSLTPGDLVLVDEDLWHWAVVEDAQEDVVSDGQICISWRDDEGDDGSLSLTDSDQVTVRHPRGDNDEGEAS